MGISDGHGISTSWRNGLRELEIEVLADATLEVTTWESAELIEQACLENEAMRRLQRLFFLAEERATVRAMSESTSLQSASADTSSGPSFLTLLTSGRPYGVPAGHPLLERVVPAGLPLRPAG